MFSPWQMPQWAQQGMMPAGLPLMKTPSGAFPVPEAIRPDQLPPSVKSALARLMEGPPKPAVTLRVMDQTQSSMISPDLAHRADG